MELGDNWDSFHPLLFDYRSKIMRSTAIIRLFLCSVVLSLVVSCSNSGKEFNKDDYPATDLVLQPYSIKPMIGIPNAIRVMDGILLVNDVVDDYSLLLYNMSDSSYVRTLPIGNGPGEVLPPLNICVVEEDRKVMVFQRQSGELRTYSLDDLLNDSIENYQKVSLGGSADRAVPVLDDAVLGTGRRKGLVMLPGVP